MKHLLDESRALRAESRWARELFRITLLCVQAERRERIVQSQSRMSKAAPPPAKLPQE
jgi:hypothetical protein